MIEARFLPTIRMRQTTWGRANQIEAVIAYLQCQSLDEAKALFAKLYQPVWIEVNE